MKIRHCIECLAFLGKVCNIRINLVLYIHFLGIIYNGKCYLGKALKESHEKTFIEKTYMKKKYKIKYRTFLLRKTKRK
jgi:hypothetical protein